ncbi:hypothetical protein E2542_SST12884 [Spatholobus suberectus]|nr:hypothetical protein E2542_SST12884 [Spatholobus suberectus]
MENRINNATPTLADLQQEIEIMKCQLQAVIDYIIAKEGGKIPKGLAGLFPASQQAPDAGSRTSSPNKLKRSSGASNSFTKYSKLR